MSLLYRWAYWQRPGAPRHLSLDWAPVSGWTARRKRPIMIASDYGRAALLLLVPVSVAFDVLRIEYLYVIALAVGMLSLLFSIASRSMLPFPGHPRGASRGQQQARRRPLRFRGHRSGSGRRPCPSVHGSRGADSRRTDVCGICHRSPVHSSSRARARVFKEAKTSFRKLSAVLPSSTEVECCCPSPASWPASPSSTPCSRRYGSCT